MKAKLQVALMVALMSVAVGCNKQKAADASITTALDHEEPVVEDCFTQMMAGPTADSGKLEQVSFGYGSCQGESKALHFLTDHKTVEVVVDGTTYETSLYRKGKAIMADIDGQMQQIATLPDRADDAAMTMVSGASAQLAVKAGDDFRSWQKGEDIAGKQLKLMIVMR